MRILLLIYLLFSGLVSCNATTGRTKMSAGNSQAVQSDSLKRKTDTAAIKQRAIDTTKAIIDTLPKLQQMQTGKQPVKAESKEPLKPQSKKYDNYTVDTLKQLKGNVFRVQFRGNLYDYMVVDLHKSDVKLCWRDARGQHYNSLQAVVKDSMLNRTGEIQLATNAGMYTTETEPQGLYIEEGKQYKHVDMLKGGNGDNFHLKPNGIFYIDSAGAHIDTTEFFVSQVKHKVAYATQSGPMLVINGSIHPAFKDGSQNLNIRNGVGVINSSRVVFVISAGNTNFYDFAALFKYHLKCSNALYLDGAISKMYVPGFRDEDTGGHFGPIFLVTKRKTK